ncbi:MAG: fatty acid desaturase family protein [Chitinophagaceae bacterium]
MNKVSFNNKSKPFKDALDARVQAYFDENQITEKGNWKLFTKSMVLIPGALITYLSLIIFHPAPVLAILLSILLGLLFSSIGFNVMHDGAHGSYTEQKWLNNAMALTLNAMGGSSFMWKIKHNVIHHTYTNIHGMDDDIAKHPVFRFSPEQKRMWYHRYQHIYCLFFYALGSLFWVFVNDYKNYFKKKIEATPIRAMTSGEKIVFWGSKLIYITFFIVIPSFVFGFWPTLLGFVVMHAALGLSLSLVFQMAHCVEDVRFPLPDPSSNKIDNEWALHQVATTANFAMGSKVVSWLVGGLNFQIEHHLFPRVSHVHYSALSKIVSRTCEEFNAPYVAYRTFGQAVKAHLRYLKNMGAKEMELPTSSSSFTTTSPVQMG